jgi:hypothetical protein
MSLRKPLTIVLLIDAVISIGFGVASWASPLSTYGTIVNLAGHDGQSLMLSGLSTISILYAVIGAVCLCAAFMPSPYNAALAAVMIARHAVIGLKGYQEVDRAWIIGNPWTDLWIHSLFVIAYAVFAVRTLSARPKPQ